MTTEWDDLLHGERWASGSVLWVEDGREYTWKEVGDLAARIEAFVRAHGTGGLVRVRSASKLACFAGQLAAWRAGRAVVADDGRLGPAELDLVRPDISVAVEGPDPVAVEPVVMRHERGAGPGLPSEVVTVNFTSGSTGRRKAVAVTVENLLALFACRSYDPPGGGPPVSGSFATPTYDGWWFDTWHAVAAGGTVVCLPGVDEDVFDWPQLVRRYGIDRVLLPAAVLATLVHSLPQSVAGVSRVFSGGEEFRVSTYERARRAGLKNHFVNLYGPTEATFATHSHELPDHLTADTVPIGRPVDGCVQELAPIDGHEDLRELVVRGPGVCLGYLERGVVAESFGPGGTDRSYRTGDLVALDAGGEVVYRGRLDSQIKVNGMRIDVGELEREVLQLDGVTDCKVVTRQAQVCAFVQASPGHGLDRRAVDDIVTNFSRAITVRVVERFPVRAGGKLDVAALTNESDGGT